MLSCRQCRFDVFGLTQDRKGDYDTMNIFSEQQIVVGFAGASIVGVERDIDVQSFCGLEGSRIHGFEGELRGCLHCGLKVGLVVEDTGSIGLLSRGVHFGRRDRCQLSRFRWTY
jgi:hypothetical protein